MDTKHTDTGSPVGRCCDGGNWYYFLVNAKETHVEAEANARLFEAAPSLLAALRDLFSSATFTGPAGVVSLACGAARLERVRKTLERVQS
jgi:hypothetical protein